MSSHPDNPHVIVGTPDSYYLTDKKSFTNGAYTIVPNLNGWITMLPMSKSYKSSGWKFHLSVHPKDVEKAWNIVANELLHDGKMAGTQAKVAPPYKVEMFSDKNESQAGKMIVIHANADIPPQHYQQMLQRIEEKFAQERIGAGLTVQGDKRVRKSGYIYYRNEKLNGEYNAAANNVNIPRELQYNPGRAPDPYENFSIQPYRNIPQHQQISAPPSSAGHR